MLPRLEMYKEIIFAQRIIAFNESFVPVGKGTKNVRPTAVIWHEALTGRSKDDISSTFYAFFVANRDLKAMTIWLDNCSSQNKNWALISFFIYIVNSVDVALEALTIKYFEPGHTFMAADQFHHQVELSLKRKHKVYDFDDFSEAVQQANSSKVNVIKLQLSQCFSFTDITSKYRLHKAKVYLRDIVCLFFQRGEKSIFYKNQFTDEYQELKDIFNMKYIKGSLPKPVTRTEYRGICAERKNALVSKLKNHIPDNRMKFWEDLPVCKSVVEEEL